MTDLFPRAFIATKAQSKSVDFNNGTITKAKLTSTHTGNGIVNFYILSGKSYLMKKKWNNYYKNNYSKLSLNNKIINKRNNNKI